MTDILSEMDGYVNQIKQLKADKRELVEALEVMTYIAKIYFPTGSAWLAIESSSVLITKHKEKS